MYERLIEQLLFEEESNALDFKSMQYKFVFANNDDKSELLKDIISFANSWRRETAYILIGIEEIKGNKNNVLGITEHLDDADLQQFINSKTNNPIDFSYKTIQYENKKISLFEIPIQKRPFYLKKDFGKLKKEVVYIRRGSSTDIANPEEIARMGVTEPISIVDRTKIQLNFADLKRRVLLGTNIKLKSTFLNPSIDPETVKPKDKETNDIFDFLSTPRIGDNESYYEELIEYVIQKNIINPLGISVNNDNDTTLRDVFVRLVITKEPTVLVFDESERLYKPSKTFNTLNIPLKQPSSNEIEINNRKVNDTYELEVNYPRILPKSTEWSDTPFFIGSIINRDIKGRYEIYADNLAEPLVNNVYISIECIEREMDINDLIIENDNSD